MRYSWKIAAFIWMFLGSIGCTNFSGTRFRVSMEEALAIANTQTQLLDLATYDSLRSTGEKNIILADIRPVALFEKGHREEAVNLPLSVLLERENLTRLRKHEIVVVTAEDLAQANGPWFLLVQLGMPQVKILNAPADPGAYAVADSLLPEMPRYDFATIFKQATDRHKKEVEAGRVRIVTQQARRKSIAPEKKPLKKQVAEEEEGC